MNIVFYENSIISAILAISFGTCFFIAYFIFEFNIIHGKDKFYNSINKKYFNINTNVIMLYKKGLIANIYSWIFMGLELLFTVVTTLILSFIKINLFENLLSLNLSFILYVFVYLYGVLMFLSMLMISLLYSMKQKNINLKIKIKELTNASFFTSKDLNIQIITRDNLINIKNYAFVQNTIIKLSYKYKIDMDYYYYLIWKMGHVAKRITKKNKIPWTFIINNKKIKVSEEKQIINYLILYIRSNINIEDLKNIFMI